MAIMSSLDGADWHIESIARDLAEQDPEVQRIRATLKQKVASALQECKADCQRQNHSSADRYAMPHVNVEANPLGANKKKKGKK